MEWKTVEPWVKHCLIKVPITFYTHVEIMSLWGRTDCVSWANCGSCVDLLHQVWDIWHTLPWWIIQLAGFSDAAILLGDIPVVFLAMGRHDACWSQSCGAEGSVWLKSDHLWCGCRLVAPQVCSMWRFWLCQNFPGESNSSIWKKNWNFYFFYWSGQREDISEPSATKFSVFGTQ